MKKKNEVKLHLLKKHNSNCNFVTSNELFPSVYRRYTFDILLICILRTLN